VAGFPQARGDSWDGRPNWRGRGIHVDRVGIISPGDPAMDGSITLPARMGGEEGQAGY